jgi:uncharacterized membrane protein YagU involved in acid resistance
MTIARSNAQTDDGDIGRDRTPPSLAPRLLLGGLAGFAATLVMTSAMARLHRRLPRGERYPLPPREITEQVTGAGDPAVRDYAMAAHFLYGGLCGALLAGARPSPTIAQGAGAGVAIWAGSYFGWAPALKILEPASAHPWRRNALMITAHVVWGAATAAGIGELNLARRTMLNDRPSLDAADS